MDQPEVPSQKPPEVPPQNFQQRVNPSLTAAVPLGPAKKSDKNLPPSTVQTAKIISTVPAQYVQTVVQPVQTVANAPIYTTAIPVQQSGNLAQATTLNGAGFVSPTTIKILPVQAVPTGNATNNSSIPPLKLQIIHNPNGGAQIAQQSGTRLIQIPNLNYANQGAINQGTIVNPSTGVGARNQTHAQKIILPAPETHNFSNIHKNMLNVQHLIQSQQALIQHNFIDIDKMKLPADLFLLGTCWFFAGTGTFGYFNVDPLLKDIVERYGGVILTEHCDLNLVSHIVIPDQNKVAQLPASLVVESLTAKNKHDKSEKSGDKTQNEEDQTKPNDDKPKIPQNTTAPDGNYYKVALNKQKFPVTIDYLFDILHEKKYSPPWKWTHIPCNISSNNSISPISSYLIKKPSISNNQFKQINKNANKLTSLQLFLKSHIISITGFSIMERNEISTILRRLGGSVHTHLNKTCTLLLASNKSVRGLGCGLIFFHSSLLLFPKSHFPVHFPNFLLHIFTPLIIPPLSRQISQIINNPPTHKKQHKPTNHHENPKIIKPEKV